MNSTLSCRFMNDKAKGVISQHDLWVGKILCCGVICSRAVFLFDIYILFIYIYICI